MANNRIQTWQSDPGVANFPAGGMLITTPVPDITLTTIPTTIVDMAAPKAKVYSPGTPEFLYWNLASTLFRGSTFWSSVLPGINWRHGGALPVHLNKSLGLNSTYTGKSLLFFQAPINGRSIHTCESPELVWHEMGHAILDSLKPELWDFAGVEADAFNESFGDISALLCNLQSESLRSAVFAETNGKLYSSSSLSRFAEQLGWAFRQKGNGEAEDDCLRNAVNSFFYQDPSLLPPNGPVSSLSAKAHSFSRIFTGTFFEALVNMYGLLPHNDKEADLLQAGLDICTILINSIKNVAVTQSLFAQVAAGMINYASVNFAGTNYDQALRSAFVRHGIISAPESIKLLNTSSIHNCNLNISESGHTPVTVKEYGLGIDKILISSRNKLQKFDTKGNEVLVDADETAVNISAAKAFIEKLLVRGQLKMNEEGLNKKAFITRPNASGDEFSYTHELKKEGNDYFLKRLLIE